MPFNTLLEQLSNSALQKLFVWVTWFQLVLGKICAKKFELRFNKKTLQQKNKYQNLIIM